MKAPQPADPRDLLIEVLAARESGLLDQIVEQTIQRNSHQALALAAIGELREKEVELGRLRVSYERLLDEYRTLRAQIMHRAAA